MKTCLELDVRYYETDQMGIVHHSNYIRYFECGRGDMMDKLGLPVCEIERAGIMMPVVSVSCKYKMPARLGDRLKIYTIVDEVPRARLVIKSEIYNQDDVLLCFGEVVLGFMSSETRRPVRCPEEFVKLFENNTL